MFGGLFGGKKKKKEEAPAFMSSGISSSILNVVGARGIPPMPGGAQKAFKLSVDPKAEARDFIDVIESDEGMSARILKISNSVYFERGKKSTTIEQAVVVIGLNELRSLLNATSLAELFPSTSLVRVQAWSNDIATAIIAKLLAQRFAPSKTDLAFLGGLMHDIGRLLLIQRSMDMYSKVIKKVEETGTPFHLAEVDVFPFDHTEVGQLVGERWSFTPELIDIIRNHHKPFAEFESKTALPALIKCADIFSHALGLGHPKGFHKLKTHYEEASPAAWEFLGIPVEERKDLTQNFQKTYEIEYDLYTGKGI